MFDLNQEIDRWRNNLAQSETLGRSDIDELESHLREEIESLKEAMLSTEEAFLVATHRLGSPAGLACEFAKVNRAGVLRHRLTWMIVAVLAYLVAVSFIGSAGNACFWLASLIGAKGYGLGIIALASNVAILGGMLSLCYFLWRCALRSNRFRKWTRQLTTRPILPIALLALLAVGSATRIALPAMMYRVLGPVQFGHEAMFYAWANVAWSILLPVILALVLIKLGAASSRDPAAE